MMFVIKRGLLLSFLAWSLFFTCGKMETLREQLSGAVTVEHRKDQPFYFRKLEDEQPPPLVEQPPPIVEQPPPQVEQPPPPRRVKRRAPEPPPPSPTGPPGSGQ